MSALLSGVGRHRQPSRSKDPTLKQPLNYFPTVYISHTITIIWLLIVYVAYVSNIWLICQENDRKYMSFWILHKIQASLNKTVVAISLRFHFGIFFYCNNCYTVFQGIPRQTLSGLYISIQLIGIKTVLSIAHQINVTIILMYHTNNYFHTGFFILKNSLRIICWTHLMCILTHLMCVLTHLMCVLTHLMCVLTHLMYVLTRLMCVLTYLMYVLTHLMCVLTYLMCVFLCFRLTLCALQAHMTGVWPIFIFLAIHIRQNAFSCH